MKVYFEDNKKIGNLETVLMNKDGTTIIVSTEDDKRYKIKLDERDSRLLSYMISIKDCTDNDISGIVIRTSYWSKMPYETKTSLYVCEEFINKDFPIEYDMSNLLLMDYDDYDVEFKSEISNKYSDVNPYITICGSNCGRCVKIGDKINIKDLIEFRKSNKITICTQEEIPFKLKVSITVNRFKYK